MKGKVVIITSGKGGVGRKTTTAVLGIALVASGQIVPGGDPNIGFINLSMMLRI